MSSTIYLALQLPAALCVAMLLAIWCGWGLARLALPTALAPYRHLLTPLIGYSLVLVVGYWHVRTVAGLGFATAVVIAFAGICNLLAWRNTGPPRIWQHMQAEWRLWVVLLATIAVGIAPILHYGQPAIIGGGWDTENYLPLARYLERGPVAAIANAPSNPLRDLNAAPPAIGLTLGFSIWQGSIDILTQSEALVTFSPILAWLRMLGVLAVYVILRSVLGLQPSAALLGAIITSAGGLLLWISYYNFGMQLAAWPLIPLSLCLSLSAVTEAIQRGWRAWRSILLTALAIAAIPIAYYPALTLFVPLLFACVLPLMFHPTQHLRATQRVKAIYSGSILVGVASFIAIPTIIDYLAGFAYRYSHQLTTLGIFSFIPISDIVGLTPFSRPATTPSPIKLVQIGWISLALLAGIGIFRAPRRAPLWSLIAGGLGYLIWLRWWQQYPYAYMKGAAYIGWISAACIASGWQYLNSLKSWPARIIGNAASISLLAALAISQLAVVQVHWQNPGLYGRELPKLLELRTIVPQGSSVRLSNDPRMHGVTTGLAAYLLDHTRVVGSARTGFTNVSDKTLGDIADYALLADPEDANAWGYEKPIWSAGGYSLYQRPPDAIALLTIRESLAPEQHLDLSIGRYLILPGITSLEGNSTRDILLSFAAMEPGQIEIANTYYAIPAGNVVLHIPNLPTPTHLTIRNTGKTSLLLQHAQLIDPAHATHTARHVKLAILNPSAPGLYQESATAVMRAKASANGTIVTTQIETLLGAGPVVASIDIWDAKHHYGWYGAVIPQQTNPQQLTIQIDLQTGMANAAYDREKAIPLGININALQPGEYTAQLKLGTNSLSLIQPVDLFTFRIDSHLQVNQIWTTSTSLIATHLDRPPLVVTATLGDDTTLQGYNFPRTSLRSGETIEWAIWWRANKPIHEVRSVLVHLLDASGKRITQFDGPPTSGARPTDSWRSNELILDMRTLTLPIDLPAGNYQLIVGMYNWPSLERLPMSIAGVRQDQDVLRIPLIIEAP